MATLEDRVALLEQAQEKNATREIGGGLSLIQAFSASSGSVASFDFQNIPATYSKLVLDVYARGTKAATSDTVLITVNGDASALYYGEIGSVNHGPTLGDLPTVGGTAWNIASIAAANAPAGGYDMLTLELMAYAQTAGHKTGWVRLGAKLANTAGNQYTEWGSVWYASLNAISRVTLTASGGNFAQYSTARLYGVL